MKPIRPILCTVCGAEVPTDAAMKEECPKARALFKNDEVFARYLVKKKPEDPPIGHTVSFSDYWRIKLVEDRGGKA